MRQIKQMNIFLASIPFWSLLMLFIFFIFRIIWVDNAKAHFRWYASAYMCEKINEGESTCDEDSNLIVDRLMPKTVSLSFNLSKWSDYQLAKDKELFSICKKAWDREEAKRKQEEEKRKGSFNERLEKWRRKEP